MSLRLLLVLLSLLSVGIAPASAQVSVIGDLSRDEEVRPGQIVEGVILVKKSSINEPFPQPNEF